MPSMNLDRTVWLVALMLAGQPTTQAGTLRKVWELELRKLIHGAPAANAENLPVKLIRFSPDGQQLGVAVTWDTSRKTLRSRLLVFDMQHIEGSARQFDIDAGIGNEE